MKIRYLITTLILILFLNGCASASPEPATATPNIMPRLNPSPTPSNSTLPISCQITDLNIYINKADGYCFAYPLRFTLGDQPSDKPDILGPTVDDSVESIHATLSIEVVPATDGPLKEQAELYMKEFSAADPATLKWTQVQVGQEAGAIPPQ